MCSCGRPAITRMLFCWKRCRRDPPGPVALSYRERLDKLGLLSSELGRLKADLTKVYKIMRGMDKVKAKSVFPQGRGFLNYRT